MTGGMAGNDEAGDSWSSSYDQAATTVMGATADLVNASYKLASMLLITGDNHKRADEYSRTNQPGVPSQYLPKLYTNALVSPFTVPPIGRSGKQHAGRVVVDQPRGRLRLAGRTSGQAAGHRHPGHRGTVPVEPALPGIIAGGVTGIVGFPGLPALPSVLDHGTGVP